MPDRLVYQAHTSFDAVPAVSFEIVFDEDGVPVWLEHPRFGRKVDIAVIPIGPRFRGPLPPLPEGEVPLNFFSSPHPQPNRWLVWDVGSSVVVPGYPLGLRGAASQAIPVPGDVVTDPNADYDGLPMFLIDSDTGPGSSGSPVATWVPQGQTTALVGGSGAFGQDMMILRGVYSGRIDDRSHLGRAFKASALLDIMEHGVAGTN